MTNQKIRILLIDDHDMVRRSVRKMLSFTDDIAVVGEAKNGREAIVAINEISFDVALLDIGLPDISGLTLLKQFRIDRPEVSVIMLSMYSEEVYAMRAIKDGAAGYLTKNVSAGTLVAEIRRAFNVRSHMKKDEFHVAHDLKRSLGISFQLVKFPMSVHDALSPGNLYSSGC